MEWISVYLVYCELHTSTLAILCMWWHCSLILCFRSVMKDYLRRHEDKELGRSTGPQPSINPFRDRTGVDPVEGGGSGLAGGDTGRSSGQMILVMLLRLRQCCCHLSLMKEVQHIHLVQLFIEKFVCNKSNNGKLYMYFICCGFDCWDIVNCRFSSCTLTWYTAISFVTELY